MFLYLSLSLSLVCPCLPLYVSLYLYPPNPSLYHTFAHRRRFASFIPSSMLLYLRLSLSLTDVFFFSGFLMQSSIWAAKYSFVTLLLFPFKLHCCINMTGEKPVLLKHFSIDCVSRLYVTCATFRAAADKNLYL